MRGWGTPTAEVMHPLSSYVQRFTRAERWIHAVVAALVLVLIVTAAFLYLPFLASLAGQRNIFKWLHVAAGLVLPLPIVVALFFEAVRVDAGRLNRFTPEDWRWFRRSEREGGHLRVEKFNAGQKLHSAVEAGALLVLFLTGVIMTLPSFATDDQRTGATFVHDWFGLGVAILVAGHMFKAWSDPVAMAGMRSGFVPTDWVAVHHNAWADDTSGLPPRPEQ